VTIEDEELTATSPEGKSVSMPISDFIQTVAPASIQTLDVVLPDGFKAAMTRQNTTIVALEVPPRIHSLKWTMAAHESQGTPGYQTIKVSLPYVIILGMFRPDGCGGQCLDQWAECFFRNEPLRSLMDELYYPSLLNCSKYTDWGKPTSKHPLSWICTQYLKFGDLTAIQNPCERFRQSCMSLVDCLLHTGFNHSSERNEGQSWYGEYESRKFDKRITDVAEWQKATEQDPTFIMEMDWIPVEKTAGQVMSRMLDIRTGQSGQSMQTAEDVSRVVFAYRKKPRTRRTRTKS